jgi:hypothetical protein
MSHLLSVCSGFDSDFFAKVCYGKLLSGSLRDLICTVSLEGAFFMVLACYLAIFFVVVNVTL